MLPRVLRGLRRLLRIYADRQIPRSAAALAYYLTMSLFPLLICLYALLGGSYGRMMQVLELADELLHPETTRAVKSFLRYVAGNPSPAMTLSAAAVLLSSASAAVRVMRRGVSEIRGGREEGGVGGLLFSLLFSLAFVLALYFGILVMLTGQSFLDCLQRYLPGVPLGRAWAWLRFPVEGSLVFLALWGMYAAVGGRGRARASAPGALAAMGGIVLMSWIFSGFIAVSVRYPLIYGSLASIILLMFWFFLCGELIFLGAAVQVVLGEDR